MKYIGGSVFGTSFYSAEPVAGAPNTKRDPHFALQQNGLNWLPDATALRMQLVAVSIKNVKSFLSICAGKPPTEVSFFRPSESDFSRPWEKSPRVTNANLNLIVHESQIYRATKDELLNALSKQHRNVDDKN